MAFSDAEVKNGDIITMTVDGGSVAFSIDDQPLGVAFIDDRIAGPEIYPAIYITESPDSVHVLKGSTIKQFSQHFGQSQSIEINNLKEDVEKQKR